jgi:hypothetical protein
MKYDLPSEQGEVLPNLLRLTDEKVTYKPYKPVSNSSTNL